MKATSLSKTVCQMTFYGLSNCYLVKESKGITLIDTSAGGCAEQIIDTARRFGGEICRILLTHAHGDHMGSVDKLHQLLGTVDMAISERDAPLLHGDLSLRPGELQKKPTGSFPGCKSRLTHTLSDGELYGSLRCISTPGHTPGHMSFLDERDGTLFAGDALVSVGGLRRVTDTPWYFPFPKAATWDKPLADASARRLLDCKPSAIATGHGGYTADGTAALSRTLSQ